MPCLVDLKRIRIERVMIPFRNGRDAIAMLGAPELV